VALVGGGVLLVPLRAVGALATTPLVERVAITMPQELLALLVVAVVVVVVETSTAKRTSAAAVVALASMVAGELREHQVVLVQCQCHGRELLEQGFQSPRVCTLRSLPKQMPLDKCTLTTQFNK
jgi:hypothetical protein